MFISSHENIFDFNQQIFTFWKTNDLLFWFDQTELKQLIDVKQGIKNVKKITK